jgi:hypothetical protein
MISTLVSGFPTCGSRDIFGFYKTLYVSNQLDTMSPLREIKIIPFNNIGHNTWLSLRLLKPTTHKCISNSARGQLYHLLYFSLEETIQVFPVSCTAYFVVWYALFHLFFNEMPNISDRLFINIIARCLGSIFCPTFSYRI